MTFSRFRWLILGGVLLCTPAYAQEGKATALVGGMLISGLDVPPLHNAAIVIQGERIVQVGPAAAVRIPPGATLIDTSGQTMLPGLIDTHVHLILVGYGDEGGWFEWLKPRQAEYPLEKVMAISAYQLLMSGVTSAVDLGGPAKESISVRNRINNGEIPGSRMQVSGPMFTRIRYSGFPDDASMMVTSPDQAAQEVERLAQQGVDVIKAHAGLTREDYFAIVNAAHAHGLKVHAHVYDEKDVRNAFESGVDVLQHVGSGGVPTYSPDLVKAIAASGRPVVPTVAHRSWIYPDTLDFPESLQDPELKGLFPPDMWEGVQESLKNWPSLDYFTSIARQIGYRDALTKQWIKSGAVMGMGTDNGTPLNFHTDALWREMKAIADEGVPPLQVIADATRVNARIMSKTRDLGTIEPGKIADIIVVPDNPIFDDLTDLGHVQVVIKGGVIYKENGKPKFGIPK
ncbi:MAG TPA: amidohydrolase family protein [Bryobacteraceae bacterium]|nr:amidohydrolase family protein [Bryobacteraceae bacterium]